MVIAFLDANALTYILEGTDILRARVQRELQELSRASGGQLHLAMSVLSRLECRIGPMKAGDQSLLKQYDAFFAQPDLILTQLTETVIDLATAIRARHNLRTPDALQAACCLQHGANHVFLSGDKVLGRVAGLNCRLIA